MNPFIFQSGTKIIFGEQTAFSICDVMQELGGTKPVIVTDANLVKAGVLTSILQSLEAGEMKAALIFDEVPMDSDIQCVQKLAASARAKGCDCIIAVGGGSVLDTAKAANICLTYGGENLLDYLGLNCLPSKLLPLVAVPTTAGTGSEVSLVAMIKDHDLQTKHAFGSIYLAPSVAILDPTLIVSLPPKLTAATGIDALTHAIECYVALITVSPFTDALCLESMRLIFQYLERATIDGADLEARGNTLVASCMAGLAFTNAGVGIVHAMAHATGARFGTHHGMTNAVYLPYGMEFNLEAGAARFAQAARYIGISQSSDDSQAALKFIEAVRELTGRLGLPTRLKDLGIPALNNNELEELAMLASTDPAIMFNPKESSLADIIGIYERALLMPVFSNSDEILHVMKTLWIRIRDHEGMSKQLIDSRLIVQFNFREPEGQITIDCSDGQQMIITTGQTEVKPVIEMVMKSDVAHEFWMGRVSIPVAILTGKIVSKGPTPKAMALLPVIRPAFAIYPEVLEQNGKKTLVSS